MKADKPFWELNINPITGLKEEAWTLNDERILTTRKKFDKWQCIIVDEENPIKTKRIKTK